MWAHVRNISGLDIYVSYDEDKIYEITSHKPSQEISENIPAKYAYIAEYLRDHTKKSVITEALKDFDLKWTTSFQSRVYKALASIPCGELVSYAHLAELAGSPGACRAVGSVMSKNRFIIALPCHRVVASGRKIGGFSSGLDTKRQLLRAEGIYDI
ncbi:methylated-DNA/protein-cysteinemethyltransferase [Denitrovibrio acetiphilus DSM 12809]|uniref:methylated-DNA--[protein]-cysteine S-methyltransferase n=1 Tax=Denitrovibrio acetiphilus (strain DSM 12809 / NBRC 114555 / N2460) TaxID=522772 RepID=D4H4G6_DENA2|nr:MGMT family protein [Denitrovibrio acetiphilus]ADD69295.1 methylated-DNA/protein-cysteinemethyltransferase [Denitrovibrio acetiphilus DSM 12809]